MLRKISLCYARYFKYGDTLHAALCLHDNNRLSIHQFLSHIWRTDTVMSSNSYCHSSLKWFSSRKLELAIAKAALIYLLRIQHQCTYLTVVASCLENHSQFVLSYQKIAILSLGALPIHKPASPHVHLALHMGPSLIIVYNLQ